ncbi:DUF2478 domain-containing protein [Celeribacter neptunius]|uniref:Nucleoside-triphosphatase THEP1 n=1 Tax=Celeribacter neptunius TaxID=588602 RepID=A0A1I3R435_9RHOB|nr:DUF2478 domain-containing protein [Celeribacter neptunius]SFJ41108.1 Protein of unknown function [Celeribacter neptunius]
MKIAYTMAPGRGDMDGLLIQVANRLMSRGFRPAGTVQINTDRPGGGPCDMDIKVLPLGPILRISQHRGAHARGCRLDPNALETAVAQVSTDIATEELSHVPDCLIVNKFGKHEAEGRGFRPVIADALMREIPVLVGVNSLNLEAFQTFSGGLAVEVPATVASMLEWFDHSLSCVETTG